MSNQKDIRYVQEEDPQLGNIMNGLDQEVAAILDEPIPDDMAAESAGQ